MVYYILSGCDIILLPSVGLSILQGNSYGYEHHAKFEGVKLQFISKLLYLDSIRGACITRYNDNQAFYIPTARSSNDV